MFQSRQAKKKQREQPESSTEFIGPIRGNRCGHDPARPIQYTSPDKGSKPQVIEEAKKQVNKLLQDRNFMPALGLHSSSDRKRRSERIEAVCLIICCHLDNMDLVSFRVGIMHPDGTMHCMTNQQIADECGLRLGRVERAMKDIKNSGALWLTRIWDEIEEGVYKGRASIRKFSSFFFKHIGLLDRLKGEALKAGQRALAKLAKMPAPDSVKRQLKKVVKELTDFSKKRAGRVVVGATRDPPQWQGV